MKFYIVIKQHNKYMEELRTEPMTWGEVNEYMPMLIKPSMFGTPTTEFTIKSVQDDETIDDD